MVKNPPAMQEMWKTWVRSLGQEDPLEEEPTPVGSNDNPLQYVCLDNPMDRVAWKATAHRVAKSRTQLEYMHMRAHTHAHTKGLNNSTFHPTHIPRSYWRIYFSKFVNKPRKGKIRMTVKGDLRHSSV